MRAMWVALAATVLAAGLGGCARREEPRTGTGTVEGRQVINQIGSTTVLPLADRWREAFNREHPEADIRVSGGGSGTGIRALIGGAAQIANSSREIRAEEVAQARANGVEPVGHVVAYDGIAVIVHPSNPVEELSVERLSDVFAGRVTNWSALGLPGMGEIQVVSRDSASGTYEAFKELVVTLGGKDKSRDYAAAALKQASNQAILSLVGMTKTAIGYVGLGYLDESVKALRVIPMGGEAGAALPAVAATVGNVMNRKYPVARALYCYTNGEPTGAVKEYLDWVRGPEGQAIVEKLGFVPVR